MGKFLNSFPHPITVEEIGFSFEFSFGTIILHLAELFEI